MSLAYRVNVEGDRELVRKVTRLSRIFREPEMLAAIGFRQLKWVNDNFKAEGLERKWKPLRPNTVAGRRGGSSRVLQDTGRLRQSFNSRVNGRFVEVGTVDQRAAWHHFGTRPYTITPKTKKFLRFATPGGFRFARIVHHPGLPARPMLPSDRTAEKLAAVALDALFKKFRRRAGIK
jgi:phage gpG-like protein